jgi:hypothetical protein
LAYRLISEKGTDSMKRGLTIFVIFSLSLLSSGIIAQSFAEADLSGQAYYVTREDSGNPLLENFEDRSTGNMTSNTIYISIEHDCEAGFSMVLDSLNEEPNTFFFTDQSTGNPNSWLWLFGDGGLSTDRNPVHRYTIPGDYRVCLLIAETDSTGIQCYDSICHDLTTPAYFDLGGHLLTGQFPINNPISTGDTGLVFLYRVKGNTLTPVDTSRFTQYGYFAFPQKLNGQYLIRAELTKGSTNYRNYFPSYYSSEITWKNSAIVGLADSSSYHSDVNMFPVTDTNIGTAIIRGNVLQNCNKDDLAIESHAEVLAYNDQMNPRTFAFTDDGGNFEIPSLPFGTYYLVAEVPGYYSRIITVTLDADHPLTDSVVLELFNHDVTGVGDDQTRKVTFVGNIYPNPVYDELWFDLVSPVKMLFRADVVNITGQVRQSHSINSEAGRRVVSIPTGNLAPGFYLLLVRSSDGVPIISRKFIKR